MSDDTHTHMPFMSHNDIGIQRLLSVRHGDGPWKLHADTDQGRQAIETGLPAHAVECAPTFHQREDGFLRLSYVAGGSPHRGPYRAYALYTARYSRGLQLLDRSAILRTFSGCVSPVGIAYTRFIAIPESVTHLHYSTLDDDRAWTVPGRIYRVSYDPTRPAMILISGRDMDGEYAMLLDTDTGEQRDLLCDGVPAYKFAIDPEHPDRIEYAKREGVDFEARQVVEAQSVALSLKTRLLALGEPDASATLF